MISFNLLVDTNVVIALEDPQPVEASLAELFRLCNEHSVGLFVDGANYDDVARDRDDQRRQVTLSKLAKFQKLRGIKMPDEAILISKFGSIKNDNDRSDVRLLATLDSKAVDFLVTADIGLRKRAERASLDASVLTVEEALTRLCLVVVDQFLLRLYPIGPSFEVLIQPPIALVGLASADS
jgi:predicted nucleic acid-binding protein